MKFAQIFVTPDGEPLARGLPQRSATADAGRFPSKLIGAVAGPLAR
jgi:hypothetical protein